MDLSVVSKIVVLLFASRWTTIISTINSSDEEAGDDSADGNPDYDTFKSLEHAGDKIYGHPSGASGMFAHLGSISQLFKSKNREFFFFVFFF